MAATRSALHLSTFRIGEKRRPGEGVRLGTVRFLPRGIAKQDYARLDQFDVWFPLLAPSRELFRWFMSGPHDNRRFAQFARRYGKEMAATDKRQAIAALALLAGQTPVAIGCYCPTPHCHRFVLERLIRDASGESAGRAPGRARRARTRRDR